MSTISIIGAGNMGSALARGLIRSGKADGKSLVLFDVDTAKTRSLAKELGAQTASNLQDALKPKTDVLILAVKPQTVGEVVEQLAPKIHEKPLVVSIAAGITTGSILARLHADARVIRVMPNAATMVECGATALCKGGGADEEDLRKALDLFSSVGQAVVVDEKMMNAVTALSASGLGYLFVIMEALTDGAVLMGMDRPTARSLTVQTVLGAATMAAAEGAPFSELKDRITSPGGTTIAGLRILERSGLRGSIMECIAAATRRGEELQAKG